MMPCSRTRALPHLVVGAALGELDGDLELGTTIKEPDLESLELPDLVRLRRGVEREVMIG